MKMYVKKFGGVWFGVAYDDEEVYSVNFGPTESVVLRSLKDCVPAKSSFQRLETESDFAERVVTALKDIYDGKQVSLDLALNMRDLPKYTARVLKAAIEIPLGYVTTYGAIAKGIGGGARAVGNVMARNRFAPIVPCHRVVKSDFRVGGYAGHPEVKLAFLRRENKGYKTKREIALEKGTMTVYPIECVLEKVTRR